MFFRGIRGVRIRFLFLAFALTMSAFLSVDTAAERVAYREYDGTWRQIDSRDWPTAKNPPTRGLKTLGQTAITFNVSYLDVNLGNGIGFDDPVEGETRRSTLEQVLIYLDSLLGETGVCDIEIRQSITTGSGSALAWGGTFWTIYQAPPSKNHRFDNGHAFQHITTGTDASASVPDIYVTVNFGYKWNSGMNTPAWDEIDLYSVLLHEFTHGLGFLSLSDSNGTSLISGGNPGIFSIVNDLLFTGNGKDLWTGSGQFSGVASDLIGGDGGVIFSGPEAISYYGTNPPIYAPGTFSQGSSLSHWNTGTVQNNPVMTHAIGYGAMKREYPPFEQAALKDIGYLNIPVSVPTGTQTPTRTATATVTNTPTPTQGQIPTHTPTPIVPDTDGDGIPDSIEAAFPGAGQTNLYLPDSDGDGLEDGMEDANRNGVHLEPLETDPRARDTDEDGYEDGIEIIFLGSDPLEPGSPETPFADTDGDALPDFLDPNLTHPDADGDRFLDGYEAVMLGLSAVTDSNLRPALGDVDRNGIRDNADAQLILNFFGNQPNIPGFDSARTDLDRNGIIDNGDAQQSLNFFGNAIAHLPAR